jgi:hypothetical protein
MSLIINDISINNWTIKPYENLLSFENENEEQIKFKADTLMPTSSRYTSVGTLRCDNLFIKSWELSTKDNLLIFKGKLKIDAVKIQSNNSNTTKTEKVFVHGTVFCEEYRLGDWVLKILENNLYFSYSDRVQCIMSESDEYLTKDLNFQ